MAEFDMREGLTRMLELMQSFGQVVMIMDQRGTVYMFEHSKRESLSEEEAGWDLFDNLTTEVFNSGHLELPGIQPIAVEIEPVEQVVTLRDWLNEAIRIWTRLENALIDVAEIPGISDCSATIELVHNRRDMMVSWLERIKDDPHFSPTIH